MSYNSGVIVLIISNHLPNYSLNCTPLSPITMTYNCHYYDIDIKFFFLQVLLQGKVREIIFLSNCSVYK